MEIEECTSENSVNNHGSLYENREIRLDLISNKAWKVGKKIVITGMAISSAPIVLPPMMFLSALGFVLAVPFGIAFAGYACAEKIMSSLFPIRYQPLDWLVEGGDCEMKMLEDKLVIEKKGHERVLEEEEKEEMEIDKGVGEEHGVDQGKEKNGMMVGEVEQEVKEEMEIDKGGGEEHGVDQGKEKNGMMVVVVSEKSGEERRFEDGKNLESQPVASVESSVGSVEESCLENSDTQSTDSGNATEAQKKVLSEEEDLFNEDKIWEQINSMRTIVGYKATLNASYMEEIKALYMFTGIEPPVSFKDPPDLVEVADKLLYLKSVIGVK